ncbi:MAG: GatB/YqeY domain-containing protein [Gammaproteobacteria bacterium]|nr:GatB/YqeY domain-containing protein [Gammaproteobacteria bacterium]MBT5203809.1 GatB/YqeY domain-containing protein [Gammaproteobacteria bacterium]MBT5603175.1 GatB/YqeY domain-containing protein [Gammaproteobacteria bacterium]MBT6246212.1 GatB/YqeY domain-containing protein [Gammaproteobacteria bacterium]
MASTTKFQLQEAVKDAMRARDKQKLGALRLIMAEIKRKEVDERCEVDDEAVLTILTKMLKQRRDSFSQYEAAGRQDLADQEQFELDLIAEYLPKALSESEISDLIVEAITETGATAIKQMGQVMAHLKPKLQGRADMGQVGAQVKQKLS